MRSLLTKLAALLALSSAASAHFIDGQIYILDFENSKAYFVNPDTWIVSEYAQVTSFSNNPGALGFTLQGTMLVANYGDDIIHEYDGDGGHWEPLSGTDGITGVFGASGIVIGPGEGDIFFSDIDSNRILRFDKNYVSKGVFADGSDGLVNPGAIAFLADGHLLIADRGAGLVFHFDPDGTGASTFESYTGEVPVDVLVRDNGDAYVLTDTGNLYRHPGGVAGSGVLLGTYGSGSGSITFDHNYTTIYHVNPADSQIRTIDPDTGAAVVQATVPGAPVAIDVPGSQYAHGTYLEFGNPLPGSGGIGATMKGVGEPRINQAGTVEVNDILGGAPLAVGVTSDTTISIMFGGLVHLDFTSTTFLFPVLASGVPGTPGDGDAQVDFLIPDNPSLIGTNWWWQSAIADAGAFQGIALTDCLRMYIGE